MRIRLGLILAVVVGCSVLAAAPALAQYGGTDQGVTVSDSSPAPGQALQVGGCCFEPGSTVDIVIRSTPQLLAQVDADATGQVSATVEIPSDITSGNHTITLSGVGTDGNALTLVQRLVIPGAADDRLAITGAALGTMIGAGVILIGSGLILTRARRRTA
jgi:hypothetical protein